MAEPREPGDDALRARYQALPKDEPSADIDAAVRAAARRAVGAGPGTRRGAPRWAMPVATAAVLVLAVGVVMRMQVEAPGVETSVPTRTEDPAPIGKARPEEKVLQPPPDAAATPRAVDVPPAAREAAREMAKAPDLRARDAERKDAVVREGQEAVKKKLEEAAPAPFQPELSRAAPPAVEALGAAPAPAAPAAMADRAAPMVQKRAVTELERRLERIAALRADGRHPEADDALERFRRDFPDYRMPPEVWERVRPR